MPKNVPIEWKLWPPACFEYRKNGLANGIFLKSHRRKQILGLYHKIKNVPWGHNMGTEWGQIWPLRSFEATRAHLRPIIIVLLLSTLFLAQNGLKWPQRSDLTSSGPHIVASRNIFYLMIYPQNLLPSLTFQKNGHSRDHFFCIQNMLEATIFI